MSIGKNIAEFRKKRGFTQEELGARLGVTNQAVSKWENETTMPDVMLLPGIADALGVTLDALYGIEEEIPAKVRADDFPEAAREMLKTYFVKQAGARMPCGPDLGQQVLSCVSDTAGAVFISKDFSFIENTYRTLDSRTIFERAELLSVMRKLADKTVMKVFAYLYRTSLERYASAQDPEKKDWGSDRLRVFTVQEIAAACALGEEEVLNVLDTLTSLHLIDSSWYNGSVEEYYFSTDYAQFVLVLFRVLSLLFEDSRVYALWRDSSKISDYLFETLWK
ncbi:MAG: helix-turn-helix transcriptional regulator [Clostridia bacterium]|nr:helix-turn-helix transcriptional regulator [Clostridia bacterium]MBR5366323.1 helix-turn-helix transcriptional regulator [Clostridia bacterium]